jgi:hypothetical protein
MPGARCTRSLACKGEVKHTSVVTTGPPDSPGLPCAMVLTVSFVLSPVTGLFCQGTAQVRLCPRYDLAMTESERTVDHHLDQFRAGPLECR